MAVLSLASVVVVAHSAAQFVSSELHSNVVVQSSHADLAMADPRTTRRHSGFVRRETWVDHHQHHNQHHQRHVVADHHPYSGPPGQREHRIAEHTFSTAFSADADDIQMRSREASDINSACTDNTECLDDAAPRCDGTACAPCLVNGDCNDGKICNQLAAGGAMCEGPTTDCVTSDTVAVNTDCKCVTNAPNNDCTAGQFCWADNTCNNAAKAATVATCNQMTTACSGTTPKNKGAGTNCAGNDAATDCDVTICCEACTANNGACTGVTPFCNVNTGACRACVDADCTGTTPVCNSDTGSCEAGDACTSELPSGYDTTDCNGRTDGHTCDVKCEDAAVVDKSTFTCGSDGAFTGIPPTCTGQTCTRGLPTGAEYTTSNCADKTTGQTCTVHCHTTHTGGQETFTCQGDRGFDGTTPTCSACGDDPSGLACAAGNCHGCVEQCSDPAVAAKCRATCGACQVSCGTVAACPNTVGFLCTAGHCQARGPPGEAGPPGPPGDSNRGQQGAKGLVGDRGPPGHQGVEGIQGATGEEGQVGPPGEKGDPGHRGDEGNRGATGIQGKKGKAAVQGATLQQVGVAFVLNFLMFAFVFYKISAMANTKAKAQQSQKTEDMDDGFGDWGGGDPRDIQDFDQNQNFGHQPSNYSGGNPGDPPR